MARAAEGRNRKGKTAPYKGVRKRQSGKYVAELRIPHKNRCIWVGTFKTAMDAAKAYDAAAIEHIGIDAITNFPITDTDNEDEVLETPTITTTTTTNLNSSAPPSPTTNPTSPVPSPSHVPTTDDEGPSGSGSSSVVVADDAGKKPMLDIDLNQSPPN